MLVLPNMTNQLRETRAYPGTDMYLPVELAGPSGPVFFRLPIVTS